MTLPKLTLKYTVSAISINLGTVLIMNTFNIITKVDQTTPSYFSHINLAPKEYAIVIFKCFLNSPRAVTVAVNGHNKGTEWVRIFKMDKIWLPIDPKARIHINANIFMASLSLSMNFNS